MGYDRTGWTISVSDAGHAGYYAECDCGYWSRRITDINALPAAITDHVDSAHTEEPDRD